MNWVGGARSRIKLTSDQKKQREHFKKKRHEIIKGHSRGSSTNKSTLSKDILTLSILQITSVKKNIMPKPIKVINRDLKNLEKIRTRHVNIPETPIETDSKFPTSQNSQIYAARTTDFASNVNAKVHKNKCIEPLDETKLLSSNGKLTIDDADRIVDRKTYNSGFSDIDSKIYLDSINQQKNLGLSKSHPKFSYSTSSCENQFLTTIDGTIYSEFGEDNADINTSEFAYMNPSSISDKENYNLINPSQSCIHPEETRNEFVFNPNLTMNFDTTNDENEQKYFTAESNDNISLHRDPHFYKMDDENFVNDNRHKCLPQTSDILSSQIDSLSSSFSTSPSFVFQQSHIIEDLTIKDFDRNVNVIKNINTRKSILKASKRKKIEIPYMKKQKYPRYHGKIYSNEQNKTNDTAKFHNTDDDLDDYSSFQQQILLPKMTTFSSKSDSKISFKPPDHFSNLKNRILPDSSHNLQVSEENGTKGENHCILYSSSYMSSEIQKENYEQSCIQDTFCRLKDNREHYEINEISEEKPASLENCSELQPDRQYKTYSTETNNYVSEDSYSSNSNYFKNLKTNEIVCRNKFKIPQTKTDFYHTGYIKLNKFHPITQMLSQVKKENNHDNLPLSTNEECNKKYLFKNNTGFNSQIVTREKNFSHNQNFIPYACSSKTQKSMDIESLLPKSNYNKNSIESNFQNYKQVKKNTNPPTSKTSDLFYHSGIENISQNKDAKTCYQNGVTSHKNSKRDTQIFISSKNPSLKNVNQITHKDSNFNYSNACLSYTNVLANQVPHALNSSEYQLKHEDKYVKQYVNDKEPLEVDLNNLDTLSSSEINNYEPNSKSNSIIFKSYDLQDSLSNNIADIPSDVTKQLVRSQIYDQEENNTKIVPQAKESNRSQNVLKNQLSSYVSYIQNIPTLDGKSENTEFNNINQNLNDSAIPESFFQKLNEKYLPNKTDINISCSMRNRYETFSTPNLLYNKTASDLDYNELETPSSSVIKTQTSKSNCVESIYSSNIKQESVQKQSLVKEEFHTQRPMKKYSTCDRNENNNVKRKGSISHPIRFQKRCIENLHPTSINVNINSTNNTDILDTFLSISNIGSRHSINSSSTECVGVTRNKCAYDTEKGEIHFAKLMQNETVPSSNKTPFRSNVKSSVSKLINISKHVLENLSLKGAKLLAESTDDSLLISAPEDKLEMEESLATSKNRDPNIKLCNNSTPSFQNDKDIFITSTCNSSANVIKNENGRETYSKTTNSNCYTKLVPSKNNSKFSQSDMKIIPSSHEDILTEKKSNPIKVIVIKNNSLSCCTQFKIEKHDAANQVILSTMASNNPNKMVSLDSYNLNEIKFSESMLNKLMHKNSTSPNEVCIQSTNPSMKFESTYSNSNNLTPASTSVDIIYPENCSNFTPLLPTNIEAQLNYSNSKNSNDIISKHIDEIPKCISLPMEGPNSYKTMSYSKVDTNCLTISDSKFNEFQENNFNLKAVSNNQLASTEPFDLKSFHLREKLFSYVTTPPVTKSRNESIDSFDTNRTILLETIIKNDIFKEGRSSEQIDKNKRNSIDPLEYTNSINYNDYFKDSLKLQHKEICDDLSDTSSCKIMKSLQNTPANTGTNEKITQDSKIYNLNSDIAEKYDRDQSLCHHPSTMECKSEQKFTSSTSSSYFVKAFEQQSQSIISKVTGMDHFKKLSGTISNCKQSSDAEIINYNFYAQSQHDNQTVTSNCPTFGMYQNILIKNTDNEPQSHNENNSVIHFANNEKPLLKSHYVSFNADQKWVDNDLDSKDSISDTSLPNIAEIYKSCDLKEEFVVLKSIVKGTTSLPSMGAKGNILKNSSDVKAQIKKSKRDFSCQVKL